MSRRRRSTLAGLVLASLLFFGACGSGVDTATVSERARTSTTAAAEPDSDGRPSTTRRPDTDVAGTAADSTVPSDDEEELSGSYCDLARQADENGPEIDLTSPDKAKALASLKVSYAQGLKTGKALQDVAPDTIADDIDAMVDVVTETNPKVQAATNIDQAVKALRSGMDAGYTAHANKVTEYDRTECGIDSGRPLTPGNNRN